MSGTHRLEDTMPEYTFEKLIKKHRPVHDGDAFSCRHPKMTAAKRAKLFLAFDALRGFDAAIDIARDTSLWQPRRLLDEGELERLDQNLSKAMTAFRETKLQKRLVKISVEHFIAMESDKKQPLGIYKTTSGMLKDLSVAYRFLIVDETKIGFEDITGILIITTISDYRPAQLGRIRSSETTQTT